MMKKITSLALWMTAVCAFAANHAVSVVNNSYSPATLAITVGDTVTWTQVNGVHNVNGSISTFSSNPVSFGNGAAAGGTWTYQYVFTTAGTYQYQCDPHASFMTGSINVFTQSTPCAELFFSEYIEGSSNNKGLEIYNPTGSAINLTGYTIVEKFSTTIPAATFALSGTIPANGTYVIVTTQADPAMLAIADTALAYPSVVHFNGNDALGLLNSNGDTIDVIGDFATAAGSNFTVGNGSMKDYTLVRKDSVNAGTKDWNLGQTQWVVHPMNTFSYLGSHTSLCGGGGATNPTIGFVGGSASIVEAITSHTIKLSVQPPLMAAGIVTITATPGAGFIFGADATTTPALIGTTLTLSVGAMTDTISFTVNVLDDSNMEGNENVIFTLTGASTGLTIGAQSTYTFTIVDNDIPTYTIPQVKGLDANYLPDSLNVMCKLIGTVLGVNTQTFASTGNIAFTIHDGLVGFGVFGAGNKNIGYTVNEGDEVRIIGTIGHFNGLAQINADSIVVISTNTVLPAPIITTALDESTESQLIRVNNVSVIDPMQWTNAGSGFSVDITDGSNTFQLRVDADVADVYNAPCPVGIFDVIGIGGQFDPSAPHNSGYQFLPRYLADFYYPVPVSYDLAVTEIMAGSNDPNSNVSDDWFEILNYGSTAVNLDGFSWDDNSLAPGTSTFQNVTIAPGEAIVVWAGVQANEGDFKAAWGIGNTNVQIISSDELVNGAYPSLSSSSDVVVLFDTSANPIEICKAEYTSTLAGHSVEFDTNCTYLGNASVGVRGAYTSTGTDVGSPGNQTISVGENSLEKVRLYPNPAGTVATLKLPMDGSKTVTVLNALGQSVLNQRTSSNELQMNVASMKSGIYMVRIQSEAGQRTLRLVVQH